MGLNINGFIYKLFVSIKFYKHKYLILSDNEHNTKYKQIINIRLPHCYNVFGQKSVLYTSLNLFCLLNIDINHLNV